MTTQVTPDDAQDIAQLYAEWRNRRGQMTGSDNSPEQFAEALRRTQDLQRLARVRTIIYGEQEPGGTPEEILDRIESALSGIPLVEQVIA